MITEYQDEDPSQFSWSRLEQRYESNINDFRKFHSSVQSASRPRIVKDSRAQLDSYLAANQ